MARLCGSRRRNTADRFGSSRDTSVLGGIGGPGRRGASGIWRERALQAHQEDVEAPPAHSVRRFATEAAQGTEPDDAVLREDGVESLIVYGTGDMAGVPDVDQTLLSSTQMRILEPLQEILIAAIRDAESMTRVDKILAQEVPEQWYRGCDPLSANIYTALSYGIRVNKEHKWSMESLERRIAWLGFLSIFMIQLLAPPLLFIEWFKVKPTMQENLNAVEIVFAKILGFVWMIAFILNAASCTIQEDAQWQKNYQILNWLSGQKGKKGLRLSPMFYGKFLNLWVVGWTCAVIYLQLSAAASTTEVIWDALNLQLLYNLDDIGSGNFGFVEEVDWPGWQLSWVYEKAKVEGIPSTRASKCMNGLFRVFEFATILAAVAIPTLFAVTDLGPAISTAVKEMQA